MVAVTAIPMDRPQICVCDAGKMLVIFKAPGMITQSNPVVFVPNDP